MTTAPRHTRLPHRPWPQCLVMAYVLATTAFTACERKLLPAQPPPGAARGLRAVVIGPGPDHPQWPGICGGAERYARDVPAISVRCITSPDASGRAVVQTLAEAAAEKPAALCLFVTEVVQSHADEIAATLAGSGFAGTLVVTMGARLPQVSAYGHVGIDWAGGAETLAAQAPRLVPERRSFLLLHSDGTNAEETDCYQRFRSASRRVESESWILLRELNSVSCAEAPTACVDELMALFPHAGAIISLDPAAWQHAPREWERDLARRYPHLRFMTLSAAPVLWHWLGTPSAPGLAAALLGPLDGDLGYAAVQMAVEGRLGGKSNASPRYLACEVVTPATLPAFARRYAAAANDLDVTPYLAGAIEILPPSPPR